ncbi:MAG: adenylate cyclase [Mesorhizobium sp.]|uniref:adenylate/guanylate cyclase domain-containing protein n=1 Tax=Mesorhizobium sp. TaxID=1871066 RepID=UPI0012063D01|nr:adenylate/guanylate cyclase domain-containing protein [Mesorhizobium sp.]TIP71134.1 MAG: adenylate cyclase [Mesorhizobium sp.]TIR48970.1 MAG: adenylate cyclase [Mesorhizobium sp.]TJV95584.1 MAG: adenylate cyclase [Mesorhizobium sp.]
MNIAVWLRGLGLEQYISAFDENAIDAEILPRLTAEDLKEIGVAALAHRKRILEAIAAMQGEPALESANPASASPIRKSASVDRSGEPGRPREAERRQLTVMFVDLVGSTALATRLDPEEMRDLLRKFQNTVAGEVLRFEGHVAKLMGDGVLAYFGWPQAHEDEAERAVRAALAVVAAVADLSLGDGQQLSVRVGIATGVVVVGDLIGVGAAQENAVVGETPNLAARLQTLAEPGTVVISELTYRLIGKLFEVTRIRPQRLPGFDAPINAFKVIGEGRAESRFEALHAAESAPLTGREHDIALLLDRWRLAASGEGQVVELFGEAGIGKSRILQEVLDRLKDEAHTRLRYYCSPYHLDTALYPVTDQLLRAGNIRRTDPPERQLDFLEQLLAGSTKNPNEAIPLIAALLSIPTEGRYLKLDLMAQKQKSRTFEVLIEQLEALARSKPVLMQLEDAHYLDPMSAELFDQIAGRIQHLPIMLIATSRPEGAVRWAGLPHATFLTLNRLSRSQAASIIAAMTGGKQLPATVLDQVLSKTEGVPLFVEELTKVVLESGLLEERDGELVLAGPLPPFAVPATLHDSLMARLDRLASVREVAQIGAVIGREFKHELLAAAAGLPDFELERATNELVAAGLVFRRGSNSQVTYVFKHALVQDAAYSSLLHSRRQQLHARIASILEERFPKIVTTEPELLAHHFGQAGLVEKAVEYNELAGRRALSRSVLTEALARFDNALTGLSAMPPSEERSRRELAIQLALGSTHVAAHGFAAPSTATAYGRARELCEELTDTRQLFPVLYGLCLYHLYAAELAEARSAADRLLELAEASNDCGLSFFAHRAAGVSALPAGEFARARAHLEQALALYDPQEHRSPAFVYAFDPRVVCLDYLARTLLPLGFPDQALAANNEAVAEAHRVGHRNSLALPLFFGGVIRQILGDRESVRECCAELTRIASEAGFRFWLAGATILSAWTLAEAGDADRGRLELQRGLVEWRATGAEFMVPYFIALQAQIEVRAGDHDVALRLLEEAHARIERTNERWFAAEVLRLQGEVLLHSGGDGVALAENRFSDALAIAQAQGARFWELRAALSLARGDCPIPGARERLALIISGFTEGQTLPDLQAAQALATPAEGLRAAN